jgi:heptosyltransferase-2
VEKLLIVAPNWLGDAVMALPAIADVHRASPATAITVAARPAIAPLFGLVSYVQDVVPLEKGDGSFDTALVLPNSFRSALIVSRAGIPERWGYRTQWRGPLLTRAIDRAPADVHQVEYYQQLVHALGFPNGPVDPMLDVPAAIRAAGADALARAGWDRRSPLVALAPGAAYGGAKRWPPEYFAELARELAGDGVVSVMVGSAADEATGQEIESSGGTAGRMLNLIGATDLPTLAGVLVHCRALVSNDSGAMHLGAALGVRVTAIFGPTDERVTGPRGEVRLKPDATHFGVRDHAVLTYPVWCRPCLLRECPLDHRCMRGVGVDAVLAEARRTR